MQEQNSKALLVYDGDCDFCKYWIAQWQHITQNRIEYVPYQQVVLEYSNIPISSFQSSVQLILPDGQVYSGAEAVFRTLNNSILLWGYTKFKFFSILCELLYRFVANNRSLFSTLTRWLWGNHNDRVTYSFTRWVFLRGIACIYLIAFLSLWVQIEGLIGRNGILPAERYLTDIHQALGFKSYNLFPTIFWLNSSDFLLHILCGVGVGFSLLLIVGYIPTVCLTTLWLLYLSFVTVGQVFLSFQWDVLLLETGFLAIFISCLAIKDRIDFTSSYHTLYLWLLRWLLFRLMFASGYVKLVSDEVWRNLTALNYHYETQPLPTWIGWYIHQLPEWFHKVSTFIMFGVELVIPFLIFAPRRVRTLGSFVLIGLQLSIILTGNYCFFNLLTILLCLLLIDDITWKKVIRGKFLETKPFVNRSLRAISKICLVSLAVLIFSFSCLRFSGQLFPDTKIREFVWNSPLQWITPFHLVNTYGLFANMTETRPEIIIEGSNDKINWIPYQFRWKPGNVSEPPKWVAPHQPRLDWQMWFAALRGNVRNTTWVLNFMETLLKGNQEVVKLLKENPFPNTPPKFLRANLYNYEFTNIQTKNTDGKWWKRKKIGTYCPVISLR
ncbi:lipase maturation factor family protein [Candidatus Poribacteria bacterium]|nr:lipase maturation factor family protein [Candidatus Poribacteria bacterium]